MHRCGKDLGLLLEKQHSLLGSSRLIETKNQALVAILVLVETSDVDLWCEQRMNRSLEEFGGDEASRVKRHWSFSLGVKAMGQKERRG